MTEPRRLKATGADRETIRTKLAICPFMGSATAGDIPIYGSLEDPLAKIEDVVALGDAGGGDLGHVLAFFARGNHSRSLGASGALDEPTPEGFMSLHLITSKGSHHGASNILRPDPTVVGGGKTNVGEFERLGRDFAGLDGQLSTKEIGRYIGRKVRDDPKANRIDVREVAKLSMALAVDIVQLTFAIGDRTKQLTEALEKMTSLAANDDLFGSAGEWALAFAFFENSPRSIRGGVPMDQLREMMIDGKFPEGSETWEKNALEWIKATMAISASAVREYRFGGKAD